MSILSFIKETYAPSPANSVSNPTEEIPSGNPDISPQFRLQVYQYLDTLGDMSAENALNLIGKKLNRLPLEQQGKMMKIYRILVGDYAQQNLCDLNTVESDDDDDSSVATEVID